MRIELKGFVIVLNSIGAYEIYSDGTYVGCTKDLTEAVNFVNRQELRQS